MFNDNLNSEQIKLIVDDILKDKNDLTLNEIELKYDYFKSQFPTLFNVIIEDSQFDIKMFNKLLLKRECLEKNEIDNIDADFDISEIIANRYLYNDHLQKPSNSHLENCKQRLRYKIKNKNI